MGVLKLLALPFGLFVSVYFFQHWPIGALLPGMILGISGCLEGMSQERKVYIEPALRPRKTTIRKQRIFILLGFGFVLIVEFLLLWAVHLLPNWSGFFGTMAWYFLGSTGAAMVRALVTVRKTTEDYNRWLSNMAPWEG